MNAICNNNFNNEHIIKEQCPADSKIDFFWDAVRILDFAEEMVARLSDEQIQKVNNIAQVIALKKFTPEHALQFNHPCQIQNFFYSGKLDFNAEPSYNPWYQDFSLPFLQIHNKEILQLVALEAGVSYEHATLFNHSYQLKALEMGVNIEQALTFGTGSEFVLEALKAGAKYEDALKFIDTFQVEALRLGIPIEHALKFTNPCQT
jgi:hypothetical protein